MSNKMIDAWLVIMIIGSFLALFFITYLLIKIVICDYKAWKRNKAEKDRYNSDFGSFWSFELTADKFEMRIKQDSHHVKSVWTLDLPEPEFLL